MTRLAARLTRSGTTAPQVSTLRTVLVFILWLLVVEAFYVFIVSAGHISKWPTYQNYYDLQAEGFRAGHLHLSREPAAALLAKAHPLARENGGLWLWDASYYGGHFYLYFGPLPSLLLALVKSVFRWSFEVGDHYVVFAFLSLHAIFANLLVRTLALRVFPLPGWARWLTHGVISLGAPIPWLLARGAIYEGGISGGMAFLVAGFFTGVLAITRGPTSEKVSPRRRRTALLVVTGFLWGFAISCRISLLFAILALVLVTALAARGEERRRPWSFVSALLAVATPVAGVGLALGYYNWLRFDSFFEFGTTYQMSTMDYRTSPAYVWANTYSYLLRPLKTSCQFPWITAFWDVGARGFPDNFKWPPGYTAYEPLTGILFLMPWAWIGFLGAFLATGVSLRSAWRRGTRAFLPPRLSLAPIAWCGSVALIIVLFAPLPFMSLFIATMRYVGDFRTGFVLIGMMGTSLLLTHTRRRWARGLVSLVCISLAGATTAEGMLLGFESYYMHFHRNNPAYYAHLQERLSLCK